MYGNSDNKFVNTVVLQNYICPHVRTYSVARLGTQLLLLWIMCARDYDKI